MILGTGWEQLLQQPGDSGYGWAVLTYTSERDTLLPSKITHLKCTCFALFNPLHYQLPVLGHSLFNELKITLCAAVRHFSDMI